MEPVALYGEIKKTFIDLLRQGMTPEKIALTIALGVLLGVSPMIGTSTLMCTVAAATLGLNLPAIQLVNGLVYPLQIVLLIPFCRAGAWIFGADVSALSLSGVTALIRAGAGHAIRALWVVTMHALVAWLALGAVAAAILYVALVPVLRQIWKRLHHARKG